MIARTLENWIKVFNYGDMTEEHFLKHLDQFNLNEQEVSHIIKFVVVPKRTKLNQAQQFMNNKFVEFESIEDEAVEIVKRTDYYSGKHHTVTTYFFGDGSMVVHNGAKALYVTE